MLGERIHLGSRLTYLRDLMAVLVARDMKLRYKRSALGFAWSLLNPLAQMLILGFIFTYVLPLNIPDYPVFLICGLLVWNWFSTSLYQATEAIVGNRDLIRRPGFPSSVLPVATVTSNLLHFLLALPVLALFLFFYKIPITPAILVLPVVIGLQFVFTLSLAYLTATFNVTFRDTQYLLGICLMLGFYMTPIFYSAAAIPEQYQALYRLNPMVYLVEDYRLILLAGQVPSLSSLLGLGLVSFILLLIGYRFFNRASDRFAEEL